MTIELFGLSWWEVFLAGISTLAIFSFLIRENYFYRFFEHLFIGIAAAVTITETLKGTPWQEVLKPMLGYDLVRFPDGTYAEEYNPNLLLYLMPMAFGLLYYFILTRRFSWIAQLTIGFTLGVGAGLTFKGFFPEILPKLYDSFRPLYISGDLFTAVSNIIFTVTLISSLTYFFFTFRTKNIAGGRNYLSATGRLTMMICFGAFFGSTIMARMALLVDRLQFLINDWLDALKLLSTT